MLTVGVVPVDMGPAPGPGGRRPRRGASRQPTRAASAASATSKAGAVTKS